MNLRHRLKRLEQVRQDNEDLKELGVEPGAPAPTTYGIGEALLTQYALPFEVASIVLLAALIGAVVVSRKEVKG